MKIILAKTVVISTLFISCLSFGENQCDYIFQNKLKITSMELLSNNVIKNYKNENNDSDLTQTQTQTLTTVINKLRIGEKVQSTDPIIQKYLEEIKKIVLKNTVDTHINKLNVEGESITQEILSQLTDYFFEKTFSKSGINYSDISVFSYRYNVDFFNEKNNLSISEDLFRLASISILKSYQSLLFSSVLKSIDQNTVYVFTNESKKSLYFVKDILSELDSSELNLSEKLFVSSMSEFKSEDPSSKNRVLNLTDLNSEKNYLQGRQSILNITFNVKMAENLNNSTPLSSDSYSNSNKYDINGLITRMEINSGSALKFTPKSRNDINGNRTRPILLLTPKDLVSFLSKQEESNFDVSDFSLVSSENVLKSVNYENVELQTEVVGIQETIQEYRNNQNILDQIELLLPANPI